MCIRDRCVCVCVCVCVRACVCVCCFADNSNRWNMKHFSLSLGTARKGKCVILKTEIYQTKRIRKFCVIYFLFCFLLFVQCMLAYVTCSKCSNMKMSVLLYWSPFVALTTHFLLLSPRQPFRLSATNRKWRKSTKAGRPWRAWTGTSDCWITRHWWRGATWLVQCLMNVSVITYSSVAQLTVNGCTQCNGT